MNIATEARPNTTDAKRCPAPKAQTARQAKMRATTKDLRS